MSRIKPQTPPATPSGTQTATQRRRGVPVALLHDAPRRLRIATLVMACLYVFVFLLGVAVRLLGHPGPPPWVLGAVVSMLLLVLTVHVLARSPRIRPERILDLGIMLELLGAFGISLAENLPPRELGLGFMAHGISRVALWIVLFPVIVPNTPRKSIVTALLTASMGPLAYYLTVQVGNPALPAAEVIPLFAGNYVAVVLALVPIFIIHQLGRDASKAQELGSYQLVELLGRGGMGEVWKAKHRMLARPAAIKLIRPEAMGAGSGSDAEPVSTAIRRFEREAQATSMLSSPHTIELYDFGVTDDGTFYYVMELLNGFDLETLVERFGPVPAERVVHLLGQVCCSLADAHLSGMVHRDVKPANVFICRRGVVYDFVKILDFGLVKARCERSDGNVGRLTVEGTTTGTPAFMPPEIALGHADITPQADLYAVGCLAYWLLTGQFVFEGDTPMQMIIGHAHTPPPPPSDRTEIAIPPELERIVMRCLAKDPADRPRSAVEMIEMLTSVPLAEGWTAARAEHWWRTHVPELVHAGRAGLGQDASGTAGCAPGDGDGRTGTGEGATAAGIAVTRAGRLAGDDAGTAAGGRT
ncbi:MAG: serine/threonine-protein kinase [Candidatus Eiseniibacteriota bacterium]